MEWAFSSSYNQPSMSISVFSIDLAPYIGQYVEYLNNISEYFLIEYCDLI